MTTTYEPTAEKVTKEKLHRAINWTGAFWVASGVPALVLFSIGGIAGTVGKVAFLGMGDIDADGLYPVVHIC